MKRTAFLLPALLILLSCSSSFDREIRDLEIKSDLLEFYEKYEEELHEQATPKLLRGLDNISLVYLGIENSDSFLICFSSDTETRPYGLLIDGGRYFFDLGGDGILDITTNKELVIPSVTYKMDMPRGQIDNFKDILDRYYNAFNSDGGPSLLENGNSPVTTLYEHLDLPGAINKDLYFALNIYFHYIGIDDHGMAAVTISNLSSRLKKEYQLEHPLTYLFLGENFMALNNPEDALAAWKNLVRIDPHSKIGNFYLSWYEWVQNENPAPLEEFKKANPGFWKFVYE